MEPVSLAVLLLSQAVKVADTVLYLEPSETSQSVTDLSEEEMSLSSEDHDVKKYDSMESHY